MTKELQDLAWLVLPKEFKEEVKKEYEHQLSIDNEQAYWMLERIFSRYNLTSNAEGEEMLTCVKDEAVKLYNIANKAYAINGDKYYEGYMNAMIDLFGSKCLPDAHEINFASKEQEHDYTPNGCTHPNKENCRWKDKSLDCNLKNGCYYEPKPAEPTETFADKCKSQCQSQPVTDCHDFNHILKDGFRGHNRLHIAAQIVAALYANYQAAKGFKSIEELVRKALDITDTLIKESEKGGSK